MSHQIAWGLAALCLVICVLALWWLARKIRTFLFRLFTVALVLGSLLVGLGTTYLLLKG